MYSNKITYSSNVNLETISNHTLKRNIKLVNHVHEFKLMIFSAKDLKRFN